MLHSNSVVQTHSSRVTIQPGFLSSQVEDLKKKKHLPGKWDPRWCFVSVVGKKTRRDSGPRLGLDTPALKERSAEEVCSAAAYRAQRLGDTSACSATAALITAETLTVCHVSMLGPHTHSCYLQYLKISYIFLPVQRRKCVYLCTAGVWGWGWGGYGGLSECIINPKMGFFFWHIL